jgi:hypothetical protein
MSEIQKVLDDAGVEAKVSEVRNESKSKSIYVLEIARKDAESIAEKLLSKANETGFSPLFAVDASIEDLIGEPGKAKKTLAEGEKLDPEKWLKSPDQLIKHWLENPDDISMKVGDFTKRKVTLTKLPTSSTLILVPTKLSWQIPAYLTFSGLGWNECPSTQVHIALLKRWHEKYGADLLCMGRDSLFLKVKKPVVDKDEALELAFEHAQYCPDNVMQGHGDRTISGLAIDLMGATVWQFWWD